MEDEWVEVSVSGEMDVPVEKLWDLISDFGEVKWMQGVSRVEVRGQGVGMTRAIYAGGDGHILEELEAVDPEIRQLSYTIPLNNPLPAADYHANCVAVALDGDRSRLDWSCRFRPEGADAAAARAAVEGMYGLLIGWVKSALENS
jgi:hypothetical protein